MREPLLTPEEAWIDFKVKALDPQGLSEESIQTLRLAFLSGLTAATEFYQNLFGEEHSSEERKYAYAAWHDGIRDEVEGIEGMLMQEILKGTNGRDN